MVRRENLALSFFNGEGFAQTTWEEKGKIGVGKKRKLTGQRIREYNLPKDRKL